MPLMTRWIFTTILLVLGMPRGRGEYAILFRLALDRLGALLSGHRLGVSRFIGIGDLLPVGVLTSIRFFGGVCMPSGLAGRRRWAVPLSDWSLGGGVSGRSGPFRMLSNSARWFGLSAPDWAL